MSNHKQRLAELARKKRALRIKLERKSHKQRGGFKRFVKYFWHVVEPGRPLVEGWALEAVCDHLEAVSRGEIRRILINVPPGFMKSLLVNVFWPAYEWSALEQHHLRYVSFSYAAHLTQRDNRRLLALFQSPDWKEMYGTLFSLEKAGEVLISNNSMGFKFATSVRGIGTGERGDRVLLDDPHNVKEGESEAVRGETVRWFREAMSNRLNDIETGVIIIIMQRVHDEDVSGTILKNGMDYVHLMIPMEYDSSRHCQTEIGWEDPRTEDGELAWPERFSKRAVDMIKLDTGPYAYAGQYQQRPTPRGGNIFKDEWWGAYPLEVGASPPHRFDLKIASLDPAYTSKEENDPSGFTIWGTYLDKTGQVKIVLLHAWQKRLELHGNVRERLPNESIAEFNHKTRKDWGLVEWVANDCTRLGVDILLIEDKASGHSVAQEIKRLYGTKNWGVQLINPGALDKRARAYAVQHLFSSGMVEAPAATRGDTLVFRDWAQMVMDECSKFRGLPGDSDNLVDATTQALSFLRDQQIAIRREERQFMEMEMATYKRPTQPLYDV